jgi:hypothetical protein
MTTKLFNRSFTFIKGLVDYFGNPISDPFDDDSDTIDTSMEELCPKCGSKNVAWVQSIMKCDDCWHTWMPDK